MVRVGENEKRNDVKIGVKMVEELLNKVNKDRELKEIRKEYVNKVKDFIRKINEIDKKLGDIER